MIGVLTPVYAYSTQYGRGSQVGFCHSSIAEFGIKSIAILTLTLSFSTNQKALLYVVALFELDLALS
jgi:hypothetical protein